VRRSQPTVWRTAWHLAAVLAMLVAPSAYACRPIKVAYVYFERNSAAVSAVQVSSLANWMADLRVRYPNHGSITLHASTEPGEHSPDSLGMERAHNVARVLRDNLGLEETKVRLPERAHVIAPFSVTNLMGEKKRGVNGVDLEFLPACPHECPCQRDDPLYKPPAPQ
jgi:hypothetical protein